MFALSGFLHTSRIWRHEWKRFRFNGKAAVAKRTLQDKHEPPQHPGGAVLYIWVINILSHIGTICLLETTVWCFSPRAKWHQTANLMSTTERESWVLPAGEEKYPNALSPAEMQTPFQTSMSISQWVLGIIYFTWFPSKRFYSIHSVRPQNPKCAARRRPSPREQKRKGRNLSEVEVQQIATCTEWTTWSKSVGSFFSFWQRSVGGGGGLLFAFPLSHL